MTIKLLTKIWVCGIINLCIRLILFVNNVVKNLSARKPAKKSSKKLVEKEEELKPKEKGITAIRKDLLELRKEISKM